MAAPDLTIRDYLAADAAAVAAIYAHYVRTSVATFDFEPPSVEAMAEKFGAMQAKGHPAIVGEVDGVVLGYAYASDYRPRPGYRFTCEDSIYLHPDGRGRGFGRPLLESVIDRAAAAGFRQMIGIIAGGIDASVRLHETCGFATLGRFPQLGYKFDRWIDIVHMQRAL